MATSPPDPNQIDHLSDLPDALLITILSFLPTRVAARTSVLSRRFRHLWEASPTVDLSTKDIYERSTFAAMAKSALLRRKPSNPLLSLRLEVDYWHIRDLGFSFFSSLLVKAHTLGLRHLSIGPCCNVKHMLRSIFSIDSLESLSLPTITPTILPSTITLTRLRSLSFCLYNEKSTKVNQLLSQLSSLEDLSLRLCFTEVFTLSSRTIRKLELCIFNPMHKANFVGLAIPSLEILRLETTGALGSVPRIEGDVPLLKKAAIALPCVHEKDVSAVAGLLYCVSCAEDLSLEIKESSEENDPFPILSEPGKDMPTFPNLKNLYVRTCFHEHNFEAVITLVRHSPALESVKLVHEYPLGSKSKRKDWRSKLPRSRNGNHRFAYFKDLHLKNNKRFIKLLNKKCTRKRL